VGEPSPGELDRLFPVPMVKLIPLLVDLHHIGNRVDAVRPFLHRHAGERFLKLNPAPLLGFCGHGLARGLCRFTNGLAGKSELIPLSTTRASLGGLSSKASRVRSSVAQPQDRFVSLVQRRSHPFLRAGSSSAANRTARSNPCGPVSSTRTSPRRGVRCADVFTASFHGSLDPLAPCGGDTLRVEDGQRHCGATCSKTF
jgi:hypothetical protein